jgi:uncharacterized protein
MATVTIRLDDTSRDDLEEIARTRGTTISNLLRGQISGLLGAEVEMPANVDVPHTLSPQQRLLLAHEHEILALLATDDGYDSRHHKDMAEVLREGYAGEYGEVFGGIHPEVPRSDCKLVWDILDMFSMLQTSVSRLNAYDRGALGEDMERRLEFSGFDLSDSREGRMLGYVRYLVERDRWEQIKPRLAEIGDNGNSHSRRLAVYERMLAVYAPIFERIIRGGHYRDLLTLADLKQVADAWVWPGHR